MSVFVLCYVYVAAMALLTTVASPWIAIRCCLSTSLRRSSCCLRTCSSFTSDWNALCNLLTPCNASVGTCTCGHSLLYCRLTNTTSPNNNNKNSSISFSPVLHLLDVDSLEVQSCRAQCWTDHYRCAAGGCVKKSSTMMMTRRRMMMIY